MLRFWQKKAFSTFEYAMLIVIAVAAVVGTRGYMQGAVRSKMKSIEIDLNQERERLDELQEEASRQ